MEKYLTSSETRRIHRGAAEPSHKVPLSNVKTVRAFNDTLSKRLIINSNGLCPMDGRKLMRTVLR